MALSEDQAAGRVNVKAKVVAYIKRHLNCTPLEFRAAWTAAVLEARPRNPNWHSPDPLALLTRYRAYADPSNPAANPTWPTQIDWVLTHLCHGWKPGATLPSGDLQS